MQITPKEKALIEHYAYGILAAGYATYSFPGKTHTIKEIIIGGLVGGLIAPILARVNPKSLVNQITAVGVPESVAEPIVDKVLADANKLVKDTSAK